MNKKTKNISRKPLDISIEFAILDFETIDLVVQITDSKNHRDNWEWEIGCGKNSLKRKDGYKTRSAAVSAGKAAFKKFTAHKD